jgi:hypothetical protein
MTRGLPLRTTKYKHILFEHETGFVLSKSITAFETISFAGFRSVPRGGRPLKLRFANLLTSATGQPWGFCIASRSSDVASLLLAVATCQSQSGP